MKIPLTKFIASAGVCSRRKAEELIRNSISTYRVLVNKEPATLGMTVSEEDEVMVDKQVLSQCKKIYLIINKPKGYTCTNEVFKGEKNVFSLLPNDLRQEKLFAVGRLDKDSRGLLILTNDGDWAQQLTHPRFNHEKVYQVLVKKRDSKVRSNPLIELKKGVDIGEDDGRVKAKQIEFVQESSDSIIFRLVISEGKKRQIRRMFAAISWEVVDLWRIKIGNISLGNLYDGKWRFLSEREIRLQA
ncbi:MAG: rRNA pseudouridine synthase [Planctomycetes bacterium]|jgi:pseudouridine synthase|nr:rRNA pseudouridine synthase [Planctomycetota bacterium]